MTSYTPQQAWLRLSRLQALVTEEGVDALLLIAGVDGPAGGEMGG